MSQPLANLQTFADALQTAKKIVVIQAENPDGDSLSSALALEGIFTKLDKFVALYCAVSIPDHLKHLPGWDRVLSSFDVAPDMVVIVDTSKKSLLEKSLPTISPYLKNRPVFVIDHHETEEDLPFKSVTLVDTEAVSTGEIIYNIAKSLNWSLDKLDREMIASSILYDSLGLMTEATTADSIRIIAQLVEDGVSLTELDDRRRELMKRDADITKYKGELIGRIEYSAGGRVAYIKIPWEEIEQYSARYNPPILVLDDMRLTRGVKIALAYKIYPDGKITGKIRSNYGYPWARQVAELFGGGGHLYAAGFKINDKALAEIIEEVNAWVEQNDKAL